jgi:alpha-tubulin suppressor-like RCC1 family protein
VVLRSDGTLWTWGGNDGELGDSLDSQVLRADGGLVEPYLPYPGEVANVIPCAGQTISNAVAVAAGGDDFTVVVDATGTVWTFGENDSGQLGNESEQAGGGRIYPVPAPISGVTGFTNVVNVAAGYQHTLALCADGTVWAWGSDAFGQYYYGSGALGVGSLLSDSGTTESDSPIQSQVPPGTIIVAVAAGNGFSLAVDTTGLVWGWGDNSDGEIGTGIGVVTNLPTLVQGISNVIAIAGGAYHTIALTADKRVWTWGDNGSGELGDGTWTRRAAPEPVFSNAVAIAGGYSFTLAVTSNGSVYAWGDNSYGELGTNAAQVGSTNLPMLVPGIGNAVLVSAQPSGTHSLAMTVDQGTNHYWGWGRNWYGEVGNGGGGGGTNFLSDQYSPAGPLQFCTRCQRCIQLGTNGTFTAECNGTLYLYFNGEVGQFGNYSGSYTATVGSVTTNAPAYDSRGLGIGVAVGAVTIGNVYTYSASGLCTYDDLGHQSTPDGVDFATSNLVDCSSIPDNFYFNKTNSVCPAARCFSLVGKIQ